MTPPDTGIQEKTPREEGNDLLEIVGHCLYYIGHNPDQGGNE